jgi:endonuclease/exonuclease/phosphatase family metal-dependent hydrolase
VTASGGGDLAILSWNLFHGRDAPPHENLFTLRSLVLRRTEHDATHVQVNRSLREEFAALISDCDWSVCLLQEAPPSWEETLARRARAFSFRVLTSRNWFAPLRRRLARWNPDLLGSWEGGSNLTLVRPPWRIVGPPRSLLLNPFPPRGLRERRRMSFVRVNGGREDVCIANLHLSAGVRRLAEREALKAAAAAAAWAEDAPLVLGGDFNVRPARTRVFDELERRHRLAGSTTPHVIDHLLSRGLEVIRPPATWPEGRREVLVPVGLEQRRLRLSDHDPVEAAYRIPHRY